MHLKQFLCQILNEFERDIGGDIIEIEFYLVQAVDLLGRIADLVAFATLLVHFL